MAEPAKISTGGVKKGRNEGLKVVTANDLRRGHVVYLTTDGQWTADLAAAQLAEGDAALALLDRAKRDEGAVAGPYLMEVDAARSPDGRGRLRETIRRAGPTIRSDYTAIQDTDHVSL